MKYLLFVAPILLLLSTCDTNADSGPSPYDWTSIEPISSGFTRYENIEVICYGKALVPQSFSCVKK